MKTLKLSFSLPDETHPDMELRLSTDDATCDVVIALPSASTRPVKAGPVQDTESPRTAQDEYVLGGYAGI